jgi:hypothetical protein
MYDFIQEFYSLHLKLKFYHLVLESKPNANHVRVRIRTHIHSDYIIGHHHTMLKVTMYFNYIKMFETSTESNTYP